jgi:hypothetical protein
MGSVRPAWWGVRIADLTLRPEGIAGVEVVVDHATISLDWKLSVDRLELSGVRVKLEGSEQRLRSDFDAWESRSPASPKRSGHAPSVRMTGLGFSWSDGTLPQPRLEASNVDIASDSRAARVKIPTLIARSAAWTVTLADAATEFDSSHSMQSGRAGTVLVRYAAPEDADARPVRPSAAAARPLLPFPDLRALRGSLGAAESRIIGRMSPGSSFRVDALVWQIARPADRVDLTVGPGPLQVSRADSALEIRFSTDASTASPPLAIDVRLPSDAADTAVTLSGGPVSLSLLGIREGAAGLVDVDRAVVNGRARMVLAGDGSAVTFDGDAGCQGLSLRNARLAPDVVRGIDVEVRARGVLTSQSELRLDDFAAALGALQVSAAGVLVQDSTHWAGSLRVDVPRVECQALLDSTPLELLPTLQGTRMAGTFEGQGRVELDTRSIDDMKLDYQIADHCRIAQPPTALAPERFERPFTHRVYLPDGTTAEEITGPTTDNWTPLALISPYMQVAVLTTEDGAFLHHHGFNRTAIRSSLIANLKGGRFVRGASTITMQLAKNLFLSREKTVSRKLEEVVLTEYLEQAFSKDQLMELYLNVIEFGPSVYGITAAAEHYFGRTPAELNLAECLFLSSILPSPLRLGAMREAGEVPSRWMHLLRNLMETAHRLGRISDAELAEAEGEQVAFWNGVDRPAPRAPVPAQRQVDTSVEEPPPDSTPPEGPEEGP